jgi:sulfinoalanine decarboxylase/sulfinoalanine decarboxylase/aspartate 1-decarboxylase
MTKEDLELFNTLVNALLEDEQQNPISTPIDANKLYDTIDLRLTDEPTVDADFKATLKSLVLQTPKTATNLFFNQLFGGRKSKAVLGDLLAVMLNNSMYTYKVAGPQVGVEKEILRNVCRLIGYGPESDGTFAPGGSMANFMGLVMGRDAHDANIRKKGVTKTMIAYSNAESHYSNAKNAAFAGIGRDNVHYIEANDGGQMIPEKLEAQIQEDINNGLAPFFINVTAGTTVMGAFDNIEALSVIAKKYNLWLHIDGAYCGTVLFSDKYRHLIKGAHLADSFSFNAHKMLSTPLTCSIIVAKDRKHLNDSFSNDADYLYQTDGDDFNLGKTSLQCGRRNDALKFWTLWKSVGTKGLAEIVNQQFYLADVTRDYVRSNSDYTLYSYDESISICFNYKDIDPKSLCTALYEQTELVVGYGEFRGVEFVRLVTVNSNNTKEDMMHFFKVLEDFVAKNESSLEKITDSVSVN